MRLHQLAIGLTLSALTIHCSSDRKAPIEEEKVVEATPGALVITSPERAAMIEDDRKTIEIQGHGATSALTINGNKVDVAPDGSFHATIEPAHGLNLIVAVDGESRVDTPFLFGHFLPADRAVHQAIALDVGPVGIAAPVPAASLASVTNMALAKRNLVGILKDKEFAGSVTGATYKFKVTSGKNGPAEVAFATAAQGIGVDAKVKDVVVDGHLTLTVLGIGYERDVRISVTEAKVKGDVNLGVDTDKGALKAEMPEANATLDGFRFDTDNAGFPCCVDTIITTVMKPKVEQAIKDGIREQVPNLVALTLDGLGVPKELDVAVSGFALKLPIATRFDSASFDNGGGTISAEALFGGKFKEGEPGLKAPGWLTLAKPWSAPRMRAASLGASFSLDAINQLLFAAWGTGAIAFTTPPPLDAKLSAALPPVVAFTKEGALRVGLGEILVQRGTSDKPMAGVTIMQDVSAKGEGDALVLVPEGEPNISITWLTDEMAGSGKNIVALAAKEQLSKYLKPFRIPLPKFSLASFGEGFAGRSLAVQNPSVALDKDSGRVGLSGALRLVE